LKLTFKPADVLDSDTVQLTMAVGWRLGERRRRQKLPQTWSRYWLFPARGIAIGVANVE